MSLSTQSITLSLEYWQMTTKLTTTKKCNNRKYKKNKQKTNPNTSKLVQVQKVATRSTTCDGHTGLRSHLVKRKSLKQST